MNDTANASAIICEQLSTDEMQLYSNISWWFEGLLQILVGSIGFLANTMAIPILLSKEMNSIFNKLLVFLSVFDNFYIICSVLEGIRKHSDFNQTHELAFGTFLYQFHNFVLCCSIYITLTLALERYRAVWRPVEYHNRCKGANPWTRIASYLVPVFIFSIIFNIPKFFEVFGKSPPLLYRLNDHYVIIYVNLARLLVQGIIPFVSLSILNYRIYWVIKRRREMVNRPATTAAAAAAAQQQQQQQQQLQMPQTAPGLNNSASSSQVATLTGGQPNGPAGRMSSAQRKANETKQAVVLFIIVLLFFICHTPRFVLNIHEFLTLESLRESIEQDCDTGVSLWALIWASVSHFLMTLNSSVNFFIYCFMCSTFRKISWRLTKEFVIKAICCCFGGPSGRIGSRILDVLGRFGGNNNGNGGFEMATNCGSPESANALNEENTRILAATNDLSNDQIGTRIYRNRPSLD